MEWLADKEKGGMGGGRWAIVFKRLTCRMELVEPQSSHGSGIATYLTCPRCHFMPNVDFIFLACSFYKIGIVPAKMFLRIILPLFEVDGNRQRKKDTNPRCSTAV